MATSATSARPRTTNLWTFKTPDGRTMKQAIAFVTPYIQDKTKWPHKPDVMFYEFWPVRSPALLFAGLAFNDPQSIAALEDAGRQTPQTRKSSGMYRSGNRSVGGVKTRLRHPSQALAVSLWGFRRCRCSLRFV